jgi:hypothetical protein
MPARTDGLNSTALTSPLKGEDAENSLPFKGRVRVGMGYHSNLTKQN